MIFNVPDMSCGHCTAAIEKSVVAADPAATVTCALPDRTVTVESALSAHDVAAAIRTAGYDATPVAA
ncbi:heavy-metal-associated domain-containing protein [Roseivivax sp. CAU 1753]